MNEYEWEIYDSNASTSVDMGVCDGIHDAIVSAQNRAAELFGEDMPSGVRMTVTSDRISARAEDVRGPWEIEVL